MSGGEKMGLMDSVDDAEAVSEIIKNLEKIARSLDVLAGLGDCVVEHKDGKWTLQIEIPDPIIAYDKA